MISIQMLSAHPILTTLPVVRTHISTKFTYASHHDHKIQTSRPTLAPDQIPNNVQKSPAIA